MVKLFSYRLSKHVKNSRTAEEKGLAALPSGHKQIHVFLSAEKRM